MSRAQKNVTQQQAVALAYNEGTAAPKVVAKGRGLIAETIIAKAKEAGVYVHESSELVALLMEVDLDKNVPPELFRAVAELLAFIHFLESGAMGGHELDLAALLPTPASANETTQV
jgi:flagellar biosynthesis protein